MSDEGDNKPIRRDAKATHKTLGRDDEDIAENDGGWFFSLARLSFSQ